MILSRLNGRMGNVVGGRTNEFMLHVDAMTRPLIQSGFSLYQSQNCIFSGACYGH